MTLWEALVCRVKRNAEDIQKLKKSVSALKAGMTDQADTVRNSDAESSKPNSGK